ncbi:MAG: hypothetical protein L3J54_04090 [Draconibacterium sp.]|nr:hypothetical protein [Draconibacterium sp.]
MKTFLRIRFLLILLLSGVLFQNCATILGGKKNTLVFSEESLPAAQVYIDGELIGDAPGKIKLPKSKIQHGSILELKADGYEDKEYLIFRTQNATYTVVDLLLGGIPLLVDYSTGNVYRPSPRKFEYKLEKQN